MHGLTAARPDLSITAPADGTVLPLAVSTLVTFMWTPVAGTAQYFFEFTGADRQFANPNGTAPDPGNGFGGAGGRVLVPGIGLITILDAASLSPGRYQVRVAAASAGGAIVGSFSNAVTLTVGNAVAPTARTTITAPASGSQFPRGAQVTFTWTLIPGVGHSGGCAPSRRARAPRQSRKIRSALAWRIRRAVRVGSALTRWSIPFMLPMLWG